jgi:hypothetical protein
MRILCVDKVVAGMSGERQRRTRQLFALRASEGGAGFTNFADIAPAARIASHYAAAPIIAARYPQTTQPPPLGVAAVSVLTPSTCAAVAASLQAGAARGIKEDALPAPPNLAHLVVGEGGGASKVQQKLMDIMSAAQRQAIVTSLDDIEAAMVTSHATGPTANAAMLVHPSAYGCALDDQQTRYLISRVLLIPVASINDAAAAASGKCKYPGCKGDLDLHGHHARSCHGVGKYLHAPAATIVERLLGREARASTNGVMDQPTVAPTFTIKEGVAVPASKAHPNTMRADLAYPQPDSQGNTRTVLVDAVCTGITQSCVQNKRLPRAAVNYGENFKLELYSRFFAFVPGTLVPFAYDDQGCLAVMAEKLLVAFAHLREQRERDMGLVGRTYSSVIRGIRTRMAVAIVKAMAMYNSAYVLHSIKGQKRIPAHRPGGED